jgi:hypothetical protein
MIAADRMFSIASIRPDPRRTASKKSMFGLLFLLLLAVSCEKQEVLRPDCAINDGPCTRTVDALTVTLDIAPRPVRAMQDLTFELQIKRGGRTVRDAEVEIDLTMPGMNMGENRVRLRHEGDGSFRGRGVIIRCPSGQALWKASAVIAEGERTTRADFRFDAP